MPKPIALSIVLKTIQRHGFSFVRQKGSHARFRMTGHPTRNVTIKMTKKEIPYGTFQSILIQTGLDQKDFTE